MKDAKAITQLSMGVNPFEAMISPLSQRKEFSKVCDLLNECSLVLALFRLAQS